MNKVLIVTILLGVAGSLIGYFVSDWLFRCLVSVDVLADVYKRLDGGL